jgi:uncharacterized membrane protein YgcG
MITGIRHAWLLALAFATLIGAASSARAEEVIENFSSDINVARDGTVRVEETVRVRAEGNEIRRGIFRDVSTTFEDAEGRIHRVDFDLISVTRDGKPEPNFIERHSDYLRVYAGDEDVFLNTGSYTYVFTYETDRQIRWFDDKPELFWNVTGNDWSFPILATSANLTLPQGAAPVRFDAYTGAFGERGGDWRGGVGSDGVLRLSATRRLGPGEGLSLVAEIPAGAVDRPGAADSARYFFLDYREWFIGVGGLIVVLAYYFWAWSRVGRDPKGGTVIPLFYPPKDLSPALTSYVHNWGFGGNAWKAFTASALSLAVKGLLVFDQEGKDLVFERTPKAAPSDLSADEAAVLNWVDKEGGHAEINKANGKAVQKIGQDFQSAVRKEGGGRFFKNNIGHFAVGVLLSVLTLAAILFFGQLSDEEIGLFVAVFFVGIVLSFFVVPILVTLFTGRGVGRILSSAASLVVLVGIFLYFLGGVSGGEGLLASILTAVRQNAFAVAVVLVFPILNGLFFYLLRAATPEGRPVMDEIEGFRMYMETAESGRLNIDNAPDLTAERFEALLPFAVALGVERPWANAFASALARAYPNDPDPMSHYNARWRRGAWSSDNFGRSISSAVASASSAAAASLPRSSSSSSGFSGGSGGGGGGRGGGGW